MELETTSWIGFTVLEVYHHGSYIVGELECEQCGEAFTVDSETTHNMTWSYDNYWVPECPSCGQLGEFDN